MELAAAERWDSSLAEDDVTVPQPYPKEFCHDVVAVARSARVDDARIGTDLKSSTSTVTFSTHIGSSSYFHKTARQPAKWISNRGTNATPFGSGAEAEVRPCAYAFGAQEARNCAGTFPRRFRAYGPRRSTTTWTNGFDISNRIGINDYTGSGPGYLVAKQ
jgi:hypothetical protein